MSATHKQPSTQRDLHTNARALDGDTVSRVGPLDFCGVGFSSAIGEETTAGGAMDQPLTKALWGSPRYCSGKGCTLGQPLGVVRFQKNLGLANRSLYAQVSALWLRPSTPRTSLP